MFTDDKIFGLVFKELRLSKGIKASVAFKGICSKKTLYNFETGKNCVNTFIFFNLLENIDVSLAEFDTIIRNYQPDNTEMFLQTVNNFYCEKNILMLKKTLAELQLLSKTKPENNLHILIVATIIYELDQNFTIPKQDLKNASDYLIGVDKWGYNGLKLFSNVSDILNVELSSMIVKELINSKKNLCNDEKMSTAITRTLLNTSYSCIKHNHLEDADVFLKKAQSLIEIKTKTRLTLDVIGEMYVLKFMQGFYHLISGNEEKGTDLMIAAIENFRSTKDKKIILQYQNYYTEALAQAKEKDNNS
ncbi:MAG: hypothetical protein LBS28_03420 [Streptococcaceae bacterium]|jgi:Rgg/GadR/MutR family transcriptional activator|nr:hypothetical protein [Streptococcaceae bacterium]